MLTLLSECRGRSIALDIARGTIYMHNKKIIHLVCSACVVEGFGYMCTANGMKLSNCLRRLGCCQVSDACVSTVLHAGYDDHIPTFQALYTTFACY